jgi:hypothetical protein
MNDKRHVLEQVVRRHLDAVGACEETRQARYVNEHLVEELRQAGLPPGVVEAVNDAFGDQVTQVLEARTEYDNIRKELARVRSSSARKIGRVSRVAQETIDGAEATGIWIEDHDFLLLPQGAQAPAIGQIVTYALGSDGDAAYFGEYGFDHAGLLRSRVRNAEREPDGRVIVELALRDLGDDSDIVTAVASQQLIDTLDELEPGSPVRISEHCRIAYPAPKTSATDEREDPLFTFIKPVPPEEDDFVYPAGVLRSFGEVAEILADPGRARAKRVSVPTLICLSGPTGVGKSTMLRRYMGRELAALGFQVIAISSDQLTSEWYGRTEKQMRRALEAGAHENSLIIFDEIDSIAPKRVARGESLTSDVSSRVFATITEFLDKTWQPGEPLRVIAFTTNFYERLDSALRSRVHEHIRVGLPNRQDAEAIATAYLRGRDLDDEPETIARLAIRALDTPLVRVVFDSSEREEVFLACDVLSGRTIESAVEATGRAAFVDGVTIGAFKLTLELKKQLLACISDLSREDLSVALGLDAQDCRRVTDVHVHHDALTNAQPTPQERRMRFQAVS